MATLASIALAASPFGAAAGDSAEQREESPVPARESLRLPHVDSHGRFFIPWAEDPKSIWSVLRWKFFSRNPYDKGQPINVPVVPNDGAYLSGVEHSATVTWVGHATFAVHDREDVFLTDPHFSKRALIPKRKVEPGIPIEAVPADAFAVISHNHYDHLDAWSVEHLPDTMHWFVPMGLAEWFRGRSRERVIELDWWESATHGRWTITCLPSQHWSRRIEHGDNKTLWCSWLVDSGDYRYFFAGDTGYFHGFAEYGRLYGGIDVAMLPIGAYAPRWFMEWQHMDPADAYRAFIDLGARYLLPMHWGTFDLTDEPVDEPPRELERVLEAQGADVERVRTLAIGERWKVPN
jgi:N-acyl-phosphatidylethanolamine-hydrolysing phospholipase D